MSVTLQLTKDHSHTLYVPALDETYHSRNGAIEEAMYVYIGRGLLDFVALKTDSSYIIDHSLESAENESAVRSQQSVVENIAGGFGFTQPPSIDSFIIPNPTSNFHHPISILEIGFGTGLNAWLTALECVKNNIQCHYHSLETFPLSVDITDQLNYAQHATDSEKELFNQLHAVEWNKTAAISPCFNLTKHHTSLQNFTPSLFFDIIYFDAFAPEKQPELWSEELFQKLYNCLNPNGIIVTYSSKGEVKRTWKKIGFEVERLPGPPFKRHMLRGKKK